MQTGHSWRTFSWFLWWTPSHPSIFLSPFSMPQGHFTVVDGTPKALQSFWTPYTSRLSAPLILCVRHTQYTSFVLSTLFLASQSSWEPRCPQILSLNLLYNSIGVLSELSMHVKDLSILYNKREGQKKLTSYSLTVTKEGKRGSWSLWLCRFGFPDT